eukprot:scaffold2471_cov115-Isochrysis_galbana.AAC.1
MSYQACLRARVKEERGQCTDPTACVITGGRSRVIQRAGDRAAQTEDEVGYRERHEIEIERGSASLRTAEYSEQDQHRRNRAGEANCRPDCPHPLGVGRIRHAAVYVVARGVGGQYIARGGGAVLGRKHGEQAWGQPGRDRPGE